MENKKKFPAGGLFLLAVLLGVDQFTKYLAQTVLSGEGNIVLIDGVFELFYLRNRGAAFGMFANRQVFFIVVALVMTALAFYVYLRLPDGKHYRPLRFVCLLIAAGALGNMIDRIIYSYVVDFLYFSLIDFPVFNVADCYVCCGAALTVILIFTVYKDDSFEFLYPGKQRR
ncbi:MAG: signal peptidase II [Candidatus Choladocola sp.]|nr:signal peptidase II [Candidatus Choladocola sp.]